MRTTFEERIRRERIRTVLAAVIAFFGVLIFCNIVFAAAITVLELPARARALFSILSVGAATFSGSFALARRRRVGGIPLALITAGAVIIMITVGSLINPVPTTIAAILSKTALVVVSALCGGIYGVNSKPKL
jgi:putative membrane protein (TIGR04086 family)